MAGIPSSQRTVHHPAVFRLPSRTAEKGRVIVFVPRWLPADAVVGLPYRVIPVVSAMQDAGYAVELCHEAIDGATPADLHGRLRGAAAAVAWCAEMNPAEQMPGLVAFLDWVRRTEPSLPRWLGGGFVPLLPEGFDTEGLAGLERSQEVGALVSRLAALGGDVVPTRQPYTIGALYDLDLRPFAQPAPLLFGDDLPTLQLPTGAGCGKACPFCFYEPTRMRLLPASGIAAAMVDGHRRHGLRSFQLGELDFLAAPARALELAGRLQELGLPLRWFALASVQDVLAIGAKGLRHLVAGGLASLELGSEAGSDDALQRLGKRFRVDDVLTVQRWLVDAGVRPVHNILLGWPGETAAHQAGTRRLVDRLWRLARHSVFHFRLYQAIPGTTMGDAALATSPPLPKSLGEVLAWRQDQQRRMAWLSPAEERRARVWAEQLLPLAYGERAAGPRPLRQRCLEVAARWRCRTGVAAVPIERRLLGPPDAAPRATWLA